MVHLHKTKAFDFFGKKQKQKADYDNYYVQEISFSLEESSERNSSEPWIEPVAWEPRAFMIYNMLTDDECEHLISLASPSLERSVVSTVSLAHDSIRTSSGAFLARYDDMIVGQIEEKVALLTGIPVPNQELIQVLRYEKEQKYGVHYDYNDNPGSLEEVTGFQRVATILLYLSDVEYGGETHFPKGQLTPEYYASHEKEFEDFSDCGKFPSPTAVKPRKGDALLFYSMLPTNDAVDDLSAHQGCPVIRGNKWSATIWMRQADYDQTYLHRPKEPCADKDKGCPKMVKAGKCDAPTYQAFMRSGCRFSCGICNKCQPGDVLCERKNFFGNSGSGLDEQA